MRRNMATIFHTLFLFVVVFPPSLYSLSSSSSSSLSAGGNSFTIPNCSRNCPVSNQNGKRVPFPFGFSPSCEIQLNCSDTGEVKISEFRVQIVTADSILVDVPGNCNRAIEKLEVLFGKNYRITTRNGIFLQNCSSSFQECTVPNDIFKSRFGNDTCYSVSTNSSCYADAYRNASFLDFDVLKQTNCQKVFSAINYGTMDSWVKPLDLKFQTVELGWWLDGNSCRCSTRAKCINVFLGNGGFGYRCQCMQGYIGDGFTAGEGCRKGPNAEKAKLGIIPLIAGPVCGVALLVIVVFCFRRKLRFYSLLHLWKSKSENNNVEAFLKKYGSLAPERYYYSDVKKMTNSFEMKLGQGGYGSVYKGKLQDGSAVAVKILKESKGNGEEFINEVASISRTSHVNIVTLLGFCFEGDKKALIYEFMANGSLEKFIYGEKSSMNRQLDWSTLYKIAVGIARGLEYLHRGCNTRILHFDIKPHNILLDEEFCPKISDFGLAKLCPARESTLSMLTARGTIGYIAPEVIYRSIGGVSHKSDVYSYGMMVLEMVGGRKNVDSRVDNTSEIYFPDWIYTRLDQREELGLLGIMNEEENKQARKMLIVSLWCIQTHPSNRPTITNVLDMLEGPFEVLQMPPKPFFSSLPRESSSSKPFISSPSKGLSDDQSKTLLT